jgi:hypothetical protein
LRAEAVVQIAPEASPLLLPGRHEPFARALQVGGESHGMHRYLGLSG